MHDYSEIIFNCLIHQSHSLIVAYNKSDAGGSTQEEELSKVESSALCSVQVLRTLSMYRTRPLYAVEVEIEKVQRFQIKLQVSALSATVLA
ncbi:hypothetical protein Patl1_24476 [Pistacia atlantica]|uniref:Uncharacterized protein n=1 Tax=Pistacia atlantica TaxID=434234 RepID=A0ACC1A0Z9_9ROSI|nr:hypothetical protein Patl1_24476 [Pistacia atlantica]